MGLKRKPNSKRFKGWKFGFGKKGPNSFIIWKDPEHSIWLGRNQGRKASFGGDSQENLGEEFLKAQKEGKAFGLEGFGRPSFCLSLEGGDSKVLMDS